MDDTVGDNVQTDEEVEELELRQSLINKIKRQLLDNGTTVINTTSPFSQDLHALTSAELINVWDNITLESHRLKRDTLVERSMYTLSELVKLGFSLTNVSMTKSLYDTLETDKMLRESLVASAVGKGYSPPPLVNLGVCLAYYGARVANDYLHGARTRQTNAAADQERSSVGVVQTPNKNTGGRQVTERQNNTGSSTTQSTGQSG